VNVEPGIETRLSVPSTGSFGVRQLIDNLEARREPWGISYFVILEPYIGTFAPIVAILAGKRELWNFGNE
jgi:hypothetical protein